MSALTFILIPLGILAWGWTVTRSEASRPADSGAWLEQSLYAFALGLMLLGYFWFCAGLTGFLNRTALFLFLGLAAAAIFWKAKLFVRLFHEIRRVGAHAVSFSWFHRLVFLLLLAIGVFTLARCWAAYIDGDSLVYHLFLIKQFVAREKLWAVPFSEHAYWPFLAEMTYVPAEILKALFLAKWSSFLVFAATGALAGTAVYRSTRNTAAGLFSVLFLWGLPVFFFHAPSTYADLFYSFFLLAAFLLYDRERQTAGVRPSTMWVCGLLAGAALACKYTALYGVFGLSLLILLEFLLFERNRRFFGAALCCAAGMGGSGLPFYIRSYLHYGNPIFPFAPGIFNTPFGSGFVSEQAALVGMNATELMSGAGRSPLDFLMLPWNITIHPELFHNEKVGFFFLPAFLLVFLAPRRLWRLWFVSLIFLFFWFAVSQLTRYLMPVLAVMAVLAGAGFDGLQRRWPKVYRLVLPVFLALGTLQAAWAGYHAWKDFAVRPQVREEQKAAGVVNRWISDKQAPVLVLGDNAVYDYDFVPFREKTFRNFTRSAERIREGGLLALLDQHDVRYILKVKNPNEAPAGNDPGAFDPLPYYEKLFNAGHYRKIQELQEAQRQSVLYIRSAGNQQGDLNA